MQEDDQADASKRHTACDECRKRKLKCSGEPRGCSRCLKQGLSCIYSVQKQMGRPRKRHRSGDDDEVPATLQHDSSGGNVTPSATFDPQLLNLSMGDYISPDVWANFVKIYIPPPAPPLVSRVPSQAEVFQQPPQMPGGYQQPSPPQEQNFTPQIVWPDYASSISQPMSSDTFPSFGGTSLPSEYGYSPPNVPMMGTATPACPCLPNLYLTLSSITALQTVPVSPHTIETLQTATRLAHSVVYCRTCVLNFQTGLQNIMMLGTLLTSLADSWFQVLQTPAYELWHGFYASVSLASEQGGEKRLWDEQEAPYWRLWVRQLVYKNVLRMNHRPDQVLQPNDSEKVEVTLLSVVWAMERRQRMWHGEIPQTDEFVAKPRSFGPLLDAAVASMNEKIRTGAGSESHYFPDQHQHQHYGHSHGPTNHDHLCVSFVANVRTIIHEMATALGVPDVVEQQIPVRTKS